MTIPCDRAFTTPAELDAHLRQHHPEDVAEVDRWADGTVAVYCDDPTPERIIGESP
jgi:hypothetical protein